MSLLTFKGGKFIRMTEKLWQKIKRLSKSSRKVIWSFRFHSISVRRRFRLSKGDHVLKGQIIAEAGGFVSAPMYASVSGTVKVIEPHFTPTGAKVNSIIVENDGEYTEAEQSTKRSVEMSKEEILNSIGDAGIVGMGGAGFPTESETFTERTG